MKKMLIFAAALLCCPVLQAVQAPSETPFARPVEETAKMIDECLVAMNDVLTTYEAIKDTQSADAAAEKLKPLHIRMQEAVDKVNSIGEPDAATQNLFMTKLLPMLFVNGARTQAALERIRENDYYGSEKLRHFMEVELMPQG
jgi:hypothetical protein